jgi:hypothetical protein
MKNYERTPSAMQAEVNLEGRSPGLASKSPRNPRVEDHSDNDLDTLIGMRNGIIGGITMNPV